MTLLSPRASPDRVVSTFPTPPHTRHSHRSVLSLCCLLHKPYTCLDPPQTSALARSLSEPRSTQPSTSIRKELCLGLHRAGTQPVDGHSACIVVSHATSRCLAICLTWPGVGDEALSLGPHGERSCTPSRPLAQATHLLCAADPPHPRGTGHSAAHLGKGQLLVQPHADVAHEIEAHPKQGQEHQQLRREAPVRVSCMTVPLPAWSAEGR